MKEQCEVNSLFIFFLSISQLTPVFLRIILSEIVKFWKTGGLFKAKYILIIRNQFSSVQSLSRVPLFVTP